jgi:UDP-glucose 4-epimerase
VDAALVERLIREHAIASVAHFAGKTSVPASIADPLGHYQENTVKTHALIRTAVSAGVRQLLFPLRPTNPHGASKLMSERMLADTARAHGVRTVVLRCFNIAGADLAGRTGQSMPNATHLIKVAVQAALGLRTHMDVFGHDYPTPDGSCVRDCIHVSDLIDAHVLALDHLQSGGESLLCNCGYGRGHSVLEVIDAVRRVSGRTFEVRLMSRRSGDAAIVVADPTRIKQLLAWSQAGAFRCFREPIATRPILDWRQAPPASEQSERVRALARRVRSGFRRHQRHCPVAKE